MLSTGLASARWRRPLTPPRVRRVAVGAAALIASAAVAACGSSSSGPAKATGSGKGATTGGKITVGALGGTVETGLEKCAIPGFEKQYHATVVYDANQPADLLTSVLANRSNPPMSVMWASSAEEVRGKTDGAFVPLSTSNVPNMSRIPSKYSAGEGDGAVFASTDVGLAYNTKVFAQHGWSAPTSFDDLYNPKYKGHVAVYSVDVPFGQALVAWAAAANSGSVSNAAPAFKKLSSSLKPNLYGVAATGPAMDQYLQQGDAWIATESGARTYGDVKNNVPVKFVNPSTGSWLIYDYLDVIKNAPNQKLAEEFVNYMLSPTVQGCLASDTGYTPIAGSVPKKLKPFFPTSNLQSFDWNSIESQLTSWTSSFNSAVGK